MADLVAEVIDAHGGRRRWRKADRVSAQIRSGGLLMPSKGRGRNFRSYGLTVSANEQNAIFEPYPSPRQSGVYSGDGVRVLAADGSTVRERSNPREAFSGLSGLRRHLRWDTLDALYFAGYAMWNYLNIPFLLESRGFEVSEGEPLDVEGESWRRLDVTFPDGIHTHSREQTLYFDERGLLRRHDYSPDVVASFANAAHFCDEHREVDGIVFPTRRRVVPKGIGGRPLPGPTIVRIELDSIQVS
jgi:hypothetical protein